MQNAMFPTQSVPYVSRISGGLKAGKAIFIQGSVPSGCERWISLCVTRNASVFEQLSSRCLWSLQLCGESEMWRVWWRRRCLANQASVQQRLHGPEQPPTRVMGKRGETGITFKTGQRLWPDDCCKLWKLSGVIWCLVLFAGCIMQRQNDQKRYLNIVISIWRCIWMEVKLADSSIVCLWIVSSLWALKERFLWQAWLSPRWVIVLFYMYFQTKHCKKIFFCLVF